MLNLRVGHARTACKQGQGARSFRTLFERIVRWADLPREAIITSADGAWMMPRFFGRGPVRYIALQPAEAQAAKGARITLAKPAWVYDVRRGKALGRIDTWTLDLDAHDAAVHALCTEKLKEGAFPWRP